VRSQLLNFSILSCTRIDSNFSNFWSKAAWDMKLPQSVKMAFYGPISRRRLCNYSAIHKVFKQTHLAIRLQTEPPSNNWLGPPRMHTACFVKSAVWMLRRRAIFKILIFILEYCSHPWLGGNGFRFRVPIWIQTLYKWRLRDRGDQKLCILIQNC
jgi:hypothetical protein